MDSEAKRKLRIAREIRSKNSIEGLSSDQSKENIGIKRSLNENMSAENLRDEHMKLFTNESIDIDRSPNIRILSSVSRKSIGLFKYPELSKDDSF